MTDAQAMSNDGSSAWDRCLVETDIEGAEMLAQSGYDPFRRAYRCAGKVYKIALVGKEVTSRVRANGLAEESRILEHCSGIRNVPRPLDYQHTDNYECLVLEELPGDPLSQLDLRWSELLRILVKLTRALFSLSWRGVSHNDVKPDNILVSSSGNVSLVDFDQATYTNFVVALVQSLFGVRIGRDQVRGSVAFIIVKRLLKDRVSPKGVRFLRKIIRDKDVEGEQYLPELPEDATPQVRAIYLAWKTAQTSDASSPSKSVAYYSLNYEGIQFPGERPWEERWQTLGTITDFTDKRVVELGCNMGLLSCYLLKISGASAAFAVDADEQILEAARIVSSAFDVEPSLKQINFDDARPWEDEILEFQGDIIFALNVLNWVKSKDRLVKFLGQFPELIFEGHDDLDTEIDRLRSAGFEHIDVIETTERDRHVLWCRKGQQSG